MLKGIWNSRPNARTMLGIVVAALLVGLLSAGGLHLQVLFMLVPAGLIILALTLGNYNPHLFRARYHQREYTALWQRNQLYGYLTALTEAIKSGDPSAVAYRALEAREYLDSIPPRLFRTL